MQNLTLKMFISELIVLGFVLVMVYANPMDVCKSKNSLIFNKFKISFRCHPGYVLPFCSPDPLNIVKGEISAIQLTANLSMWSDRWGYEKCSVIDERLVFSRV
jgi:hypothetical protein